jgi:hypothetical protein
MTSQDVRPWICAAIAPPGAAPQLASEAPNTSQIASVHARVLPACRDALWHSDRPAFAAEASTRCEPNAITMAAVLIIGLILVASCLTAAATREAASIGQNSCGRLLAARPRPDLRPGMGVQSVSRELSQERHSACVPASAAIG